MTCPNCSDMNCLVFTGGWDGHEPKQCSEYFVPWLKEIGFSVRQSDSLDCLLDESYVNSCRLIVPVWTMGEISGDQSKALREAVKAGCGLAGWHGGMCDSFRQDTEYQFMTGGQWVVHPGGVMDYRVNVINHDDPITRGISDFDMHSEQYYMHTDPSNEVLVTTTFKGDQDGIDWIAGCVMPVVWKRMYGKGRVFYSSLGHVASDFEAAEPRELVKRGMLWAAGLEVTPQDIK